MRLCHVLIPPVSSSFSSFIFGDHSDCPLRAREDLWPFYIVIGHLQPRPFTGAQREAELPMDR
jgi:hypothetical protein